MDILNLLYGRDKINEKKFFCRINNNNNNNNNNNKNIYTVKIVDW